MNYDYELDWNRLRAMEKKRKPGSSDELLIWSEHGLDLARQYA